LIKGCIRETPNPGIMNTGNRLLLPVFGILLDVHCSNRGYSGKSILRSSNSLMVFGKYSEVESKLSKKIKQCIYVYIYYETYYQNAFMIKHKNSVF